MAPVLSTLRKSPPPPRRDSEEQEAQTRAPTLQEMDERMQMIADLLKDKLVYDRCPVKVEGLKPSPRNRPFVQAQGDNLAKLFEANGLDTHKFKLRLEFKDVASREKHKEAVRKWEEENPEDVGKGKVVPPHPSLVSCLLFDHLVGLVTKSVCHIVL